MLFLLQYLHIYLVSFTIDNKYYVTGMENSNLTNETMRVESIKRN